MTRSAAYSEILTNQPHPQFIKAAMRYLVIPLSLIILFAIFSFSGTVGRLFALGDRSGAAAILAYGILMTFANAFLISRTVRTPLWKWGGAIAFLLVAGTIGMVSARSAYNSTPAYIIERITIKAVGLDVESKSARFEMRAELKILKEDLENIFWGGLGATGEIKNVSVSRLTGDFNLDKKEEAGNWQLHLRFPKAPKRGELIEFASAFDIAGTKPEDKAYVVHTVNWPTENLGITIQVFKERPCKTVEAFSADAHIIGADTKAETPPLVSADGSELHWSTSDAQEGRKYIVICNQQPWLVSKNPLN